VSIPSVPDTVRKGSSRATRIRYVLAGSVQRDQNRVRVNAQLMDAESGAHLWAER
jgi:TolB-like protein